MNNETENTSPKGIFKKLKRLKLLELSPTIIGAFFFAITLIFCLFLLDYRFFETENHVVSSTWFFEFNNGSSSSSIFELNNGSSSSPILSGGGEVKKVNFLEDGGNSCDIFDGNWVWDENYPLYESKDCLFLDGGFSCSENGRPDNFYTKWRWQPKDCNLPRFDAKDMLSRLRNRRLVFVGDSIGRNQWESLLCLLSSVVPNKKSIYEVNGHPITKHTGSLVFKFWDFNCTIEYYRAPFLVPQTRAPKGSPKNVSTTLRLDLMDWTSKKWKGADILIFNSGHWWNFQKTIRSGCYFQVGKKIKMEMSVADAYKRSIETLFDWVNREVDSKKTRVFFRSYAPVHFRGGDWKTGGSCHSEMLPDLSSSPVSSDKVKTVTDVLLKRSAKSQLRSTEFLNITGMTSRRKDGHLSLYYLGPGKQAPISRQDCSHWCLPGVPDVWNELLYAVFLKREIVRQGNASAPSHSPQQ